MRENVAEWFFRELRVELAGQQRNVHSIRVRSTASGTSLCVIT